MADADKPNPEQTPGVTPGQTEPEGSRQYSKEEFNQVISQRDSAKENLRTIQAELDKYKEAEKQKEKEDAEAKGNYQQLISEKEKELEALKGKSDEQEKFIEEIRTDLINGLPEEHKAIAGKLSLSDLKAYAKLNTPDNKKNTDQGIPGGARKLDLTGKKWDDFTMTDRDEIRKNNKVAYAKLYEEKYRIKLPA